MEFNTIVYEKGDGIALVTLNRPKSLNALCDELIGELGMVFHEIDEDRDIAVVIITGGEKVLLRAQTSRKSAKSPLRLRPISLYPGSMRFSTESKPVPNR